MKCACGGESKVTDSRLSSGAVMRRRRCDACGERWTTREVRVRADALRMVDAEAVARLHESIAVVCDRLTDVMASSGRPRTEWGRKPAAERANR